MNLSRGEREGRERRLTLKTMACNAVSQSTKHLREIVLAELICNLCKATNYKLHNVALNLSRKGRCLFKLRHLKAAKLQKALAWGNWHSPVLLGSKSV